MLDNFPGVQILTRPLPYNLLSAPHQVRFYFRILLLTYNAINGLVPFYLQDLINLEARKYKFMLRLCPNHARNFYKKSSEKFFDVIFHKKYLPIISKVIDHWTWNQKRVTQRNFKSWGLWHTNVCYYNTNNIQEKITGFWLAENSAVFP